LLRNLRFLDFCSTAGGSAVGVFFAEQALTSTTRMAARMTSKIRRWVN
jgi:hypothetical protein